MLLSVNQNLFNIGIGDFTTPATDTVPTEDWTFTLDANTTGGTLDIVTSFGPNNANNFCVVFATAGLSTGRQSATTQYRRIGIIQADASGTHAIAGDYITKYGSLPPIGTKAFVKLLQIDSGSGLAGVSFWDADTAY